MSVGVPIAAVFLPIAWWLLVYVLHPPGEAVEGADEVLAGERASLGRMSRGEAAVALAFGLAVAGWLLREPKVLGSVTVPGVASFLPQVTDATIAMGAALLLFVVPVDPRRGGFAADWSVARSVPWGVLLLFGGGLSLAKTMEVTRLSDWLGGLVEGLAGFPAVVVVVAVTTLFVFLTEVTSNTATATMAMPIMAAAALGLGLDPIVLMTAAALAASMAFMLPVATPPNAIVFGSGLVTVPTMARAGFLLNLIAIALITFAASWWVPVLLE